MSFIPHPDTSNPLPCAHHRADFRSGLTLSRKRSRARLLPLPQEQIDARDEHEVKLQTARHHRIDYYYNMLRKSRGSRGRRGARDASVDTTVLCARLWAGLVAARLRLGRRLGCRFCRRLCGPALYGRWQSCPARARARRVALARAHAIAIDRQGTRDVAHVRVRPASTKCVMLSRGGDHLSGGTLDGGHGGSVRPSGGGPRACMAAQECSGVSDRFA